jgi:hypothetical protein
MVRWRLLLTGITLLSLSISLAASPWSSEADEGGACSALGATTGGCTTDINANIEGDEAVLDGTEHGPGGGHGGTSGNAAGNPAEKPCVLPACDLNAVDRREFTVTMVTLADLVGFRPVPGIDHMEPNGWMIVGLDTNFYATGAAHVETGTLLGLPASVRFTPIRWNWSYGDGATATRSTQGATWALQNIREFDPTATSHVYERGGTYFIDLTVTYRAEFTFDGSDWATIAGTLTAPANRLVATVGDAKTVLVQNECTANPAGPGC